jgi:hypothetical protein
MINSSISTLPKIDITRSFYSKNNNLIVKVTNKNSYWSVTGAKLMCTPYGFMSAMMYFIIEIEDILGDSIKPLTSMHLSCAKTGIPPNSFKNGLYWLAGCFPEHGFGERFHGGNTSGEYTPETCFKYFCSHFRINEDEANELKAECLKVWNSCAEKNESKYLGNLKVRQVLSDFHKRMEPRWQAENDFLLNGGVEKILDSVRVSFDNENSSSNIRVD